MCVELGSHVFNESISVVPLSFLERKKKRRSSHNIELDSAFYHKKYIEAKLQSKEAVNSHLCICT